MAVRENHPCDCFLSRLTLSVLCVAIGCNGDQVGSGGENAELLAKKRHKTVESSWVTSQDGALSLRLILEADEVEKVLPVAAELRNNTQAAMYVLRPFGDEFRAWSSDIVLDGPDGKLKYMGPQLTYPLGEMAFATLSPGESIRDRLEMSMGIFSGSDKPGTYRITFTYSVTKHDQVSGSPEGSKLPWIGEIKTLPMSVTKR